MADTPDVAIPDTQKTSQTVITVDSSSSDDLKSKVVYSARDSIRMDAENEKVYLYGAASIHYEDIDLKSDLIVIDWNKKEVFAEGITDSSGRVSGKPIFKQGNQEFKTSTIRYNFNSKKGKITYVTTKEGEGYVHGESVKKDSANNLYIRKGKYTTCDADTPHFYIGTNRLKITSKKRVVTGPAYLVLEDVPTPFIIPFGYFPNSGGRSSGFIFPDVGESPTRGFFVRKIGWYFGINDYVDAALTGDIYTKGSYLVDGTTRYVKKYKYNGRMNFSYSYNITSEPELPDYSTSTDFHIGWQHTQDAKANPGSIFSANVNAGTSTFYQSNVSLPGQYLSNTFNSSISYTKYLGSKANLVTSLTHSQNSVTRDISLSLPNLAFNLTRITPFQAQKGTSKWYNNLGFSLSTVAENRIDTKDSLLFKKESLDNFKYGMKHVIPLSTSIKVLKYATLSPSINYVERWYPQYTTYTYNPSTERVDTTVVHGFKAVRDYVASAGLSTKIYGMFLFKSGKIAAIRHVITPAVGFSYHPNYADPRYGYYNTVQVDSTGRTVNYAIFQNSLYGGPAAGKYGFISFGFDNNIEMKLRTQTDTGTSTKKVKIFESLSVGSGYNLAVDSFNLANISLNGRTSLFDFFNIQFSTVFDPYILDESGVRRNKFEINENGRLARLTNANGALGFSINQHDKKAKSSAKASEQDLRYINEHPEDFVDFTIPWNISVNYNISYSKTGLEALPLTQSVRFDGDFSLTSRWKLGFNSGYDFTAAKVSYTAFNIYRDMHCWEMRFNWVPFGAQENYFFQINVRSSVLQDLKLTKKTDFYDR